MESIKIKLNGEDKEIDPGLSAARLLEILKITPGTVVVEHNLKILKKAEHDKTILNNNDTVEIVHFVGGG